MRAEDGGRLYRAIRNLRDRRNPVVIGTVSAMAGVNRHTVVIDGAEQEMPAVGGATAEVGDSVAVLVNTGTGEPIGVLGALNVGVSTAGVYDGDGWPPGTILHEDLPDVTPNQHHAQVHALVGPNHTVGGLTPGHFLKATGETTFGFVPHGLTYSDVGAAAVDHNHDGVYSPVGHGHAWTDVSKVGSSLADLATRSHSDLTDVSADQHHSQAHALVGADHSASGLTAGHILTALTETTFGFAAPAAPAAHALLSAIHSDTTAAAVERGDIIIGSGATPKWARLAKAAGVLVGDGTEPAWSVSPMLTSLLVSEGVATQGAAAQSSYGWANDGAFIAYITRSGHDTWRIVKTTTGGYCLSFQNVTDSYFAHLNLLDDGSTTLGGNLSVNGGYLGINGDTDLLQLAANSLTVNGEIFFAASKGLRFEPLGAAYNLIRSYTAQYEDLFWDTRYPLIIQTVSSGAVEIIDHLGNLLMAVRGTSGDTRIGGDLRVDSGYLGISSDTDLIQLLVNVVNINGYLNLSAGSALTIPAGFLGTDISTGLKIGTAVNQKLGFFNATPVMQRSHIADPDNAPPTAASNREAIVAMLLAMEQLGFLAAT